MSRPLSPLRGSNPRSLGRDDKKRRSRGRWPERPSPSNSNLIRVSVTRVSLQHQMRTLRCKLPDHTFAQCPAEVCGAVQNAAGIDGYVADGKSAVVPAAEIVQIGEGPAAARRREFKNEAVVGGAARGVGSVDIACRVERQAAERTIEAVEGLQQAVIPVATRGLQLKNGSAGETGSKQIAVRVEGQPSQWEPPPPLKSVSVFCVQPPPDGLNSYTVPRPRSPP